MGRRDRLFLNVVYDIDSPTGPKADMLTSVYSRKERIECNRELETVSRRMGELSPKLQSAMMTAMPYMMDPQVQQAMTAQAQALAQAGQ